MTEEQMKVIWAGQAMQALLESLVWRDGEQVKVPSSQLIVEGAFDCAEEMLAEWNKRNKP